MRTSTSENTLISVVTPVYNGSPFVADAYRCLCRQTHTCWEWVVVDDGSTDDTWQRLTTLAAKDPRVRCFTQPASGSAKQPRDHAVCEANGPFVIPLDIDDRLSDDYLAVMLSRQQETDADIVYPRMIFTDLDTNTTTQELPAADFDTTRVYRGRDLVRETVPEWRIGCNGGIYRKEAWINRSWPEKHEPIWMNSDEVDERLYQLNAQRVAFATAHYYYQNHQESITTKVTPKLFHTQKTSLQLLALMAKEFGPDSHEYWAMQRNAFCDWRWKMAAYVKNYRQLACADAVIHQNLADCFSQLSPCVLSRGERLQFLNLSSFPAVLALYCLKYAPRLLAEKIMQRLCPTLYTDRIVRRRTENDVRRQLASSYSVQTEHGGQPTVISLFCGNVKSGGLTDRLRGAVSTYQACMATGRTFKLYFVHPFALTDYLEPADYDWRIEPADVSFAAQTATIVANATTGLPAERQKHARLLATELARTKDRQVHVYTNAASCYDNGFAEAFGTLFRPTARLQARIDALRKTFDAGAGYITVSARFCNLLDDFNEEVYGEPLDYEQRDRLVDNCISQLAQLRKKHPGQTIVVCSDSTTFLRRAQEQAGASIIPGTVSHIGNDKTQDYEYYEKTFLDFFVIAGASHVYLLKGPGMMQSGFPYAAALSTARPYDIIAFN